MGPNPRSRSEDVRSAAAAWVVRLTDAACTPGDRVAFESWRALSTEREVAYERELAAWERLHRLQAFRPAEGPPDPDLLAPRRSAAPVRSYARLRLAAAAAGLAMLVGASAWLGLTIVASPAYATGLGERRLVVLSDGSRIELNTDSKIVVRYRTRTREVELLRGEALFDVANDVRPFFIEAKNTKLRAGKSELAVRLKEGGAAVTVREGAVAVEPRSKEESESRMAVLNPGTEGFYGPAGTAVYPISAAEINRSLAWRQGAIALNGEPLSQAVQEFNRYNHEQMVISDDSIATLRLAGYFQTSDLQGFVTAVTHTFPVQAQRSGDSIYLSRKR